ncbi:T9SS type A sorting domain-containing protein [Winogradskyella tangerina]|uniref:T9SS type A sorting domain-containing protein n=1 Tax=Winogradskyella tangerina TaxID=2023240 RepID=UPI000DBE0ED5|nr:T9SS type A sorting domain-containing protein [Winogradskyella tangerina]
MKARILLSATLIFGFLVSRAQQLTLETPLDATVNETSGLLFLNSTLITHNDSENANELYDIDSTTGLVTRTVTISNATNADWEDLANDDTYIYIGDFGNFRGDRTDLKVYRITIADYFASTSVTADVINFSYSDQTDFTPNPLATNFDAEGLIHYNNNLYVFTKNWLDGNTNIYELPKTPGTHSISNIDSIMAQGLVSGATYNALDNSIFITGYDLSGAFLIQLSGFNSGLFSNGTVTRTSVSVPANFSVQVEAITPINANEYYITSEENSPDASGLFSFNVSTLEVSETHIEEFSFYPNPADEKIVLSNDQLITHIYTVTGQVVSSSNQREIDISELKSGIYIIKMQDEVTGNSQIKRLLIN